ncbi:MAG: hypothetical protein N2037_12100 [Acidimicrobiales bacterium]|nr:hypothetical protein [Acidimicrobiales bacterium]
MPDREERDEGQTSGDDEFAVAFDEQFIRSAPVREPNWKEREREAKRLQRQHRKEQQQFKRRRRAARFGGWSDKKGLLILIAVVVAGFIFAGLEGRGPLGFLRDEPGRKPPAVSTTTAPADSTTVVQSSTAPPGGDQPTGAGSSPTGTG